MASGAPGGGISKWIPNPPQRGSFPLDHDKECSLIMKDYLRCLKLVDGTNAHGCRLLAKSYLKCRMTHGLMEQDEWRNLGLPEDDKPLPLRKLPSHGDLTKDPVDSKGGTTDAAPAAAASPTTGKSASAS